MTQGFAADPAQVRRVLQTIPLRKLARTHDVAMTILYLASAHLSGHVTGQVLTVSGGMDGRDAEAEGAGGESEAGDERGEAGQADGHEPGG